LTPFPVFLLTALPELDADSFHFLCTNTGFKPHHFNPSQYPQMQNWPPLIKYRPSLTTMAGLLISHYKSNHAGPQDRSMVHAKVLIEQISAGNKFSCGHSHSLQTGEPPLDQQLK